MPKDNVDYRLMNRTRVDEACRSAADDECVLCGWFKCLECSEQHMALQPIPDWAHSLASKAQCHGCLEMEAVLMMTDDFVRIPSRNQEKASE